MLNLPLNRLDPQRGAGRLLSAALAPLGGAWSAVTRLRALAWRRGLRQAAVAPVPVISVGNLTSGGTGKTPLVLLLAGWLEEAGLRPAVLTRGYGGRRSAAVRVAGRGAGAASWEEVGDEALLLAGKLPEVPVLVGHDRVRTAGEAVKDLGARSLLLDDGFQHLRLGRNLDIVLVDASRPLWQDRVLPAGTLREPLAALGRAGLLVVTRCPAGGPPPELLRLLTRWAPRVPVFLARHVGSALRRFGGPPAAQIPADGLSWLLASGIGNPGSFRATAASFGLRVAGESIFPDHHPFRPRDLEAIGRARSAVAADAVLFTEKDEVRLAGAFGSLPWPAFALEMRLELEGEEEMKRRVLEVAAGRGSRRQAAR